ncbi:MAG: hypothetical protein GXP45_07350 [bacterium]|nr:hypothetical protein [bacterium]
MAASFSLYTKDTNVILGCPFELQVLVDTEGQEITAADMDLFYNDQVFSVK